MGLTILVDHDLRRVKGLEQVVHQGPSVLGVMAFYQSEGMLPKNFLRGIGLIEPVLSQLPALFQTPFSIRPVRLKVISMMNHLWNDLLLICKP